MKLFSFFTSAFLSLSALAHSPNNLPAKGYCFLNDSRIFMERVPNQPISQEGILAWQAKLTEQLTAEVKFRPGFGMTSVLLVLRRHDAAIGHSKMWISGDINPDDSKPPPSEADLHLFDSLGFEVLAPEGRVCCEYNLYFDRPDTQSFYCGEPKMESVGTGPIPRRGKGVRLLLVPKGAGAIGTVYRQTQLVRQFQTVFPSFSSLSR